MSDTPNLQVMAPMDDKVQVQAPVITVTEDEAMRIMEELGLVSLGRDPATEEAKQAGFDLRKALRLGVFVEENAVRLDNSKILIADQILMTHLMRLNAKAGEMKTQKELAEIAYPIGYIASQLKKSSKSKVIIEAVQGGATRQSQPSWAPGEKVLPPAKAS